MSKCDFNKAARQRYWNRTSSVNLLHILRAPFPKNTSGGLLLYLLVQKPTIETPEQWVKHVQG